MKIIIGASRNSKIGSKLIQWWIGAPYSHVYARWHLNDQERDIVYQASHGMVHFKAFENFKKENEIVKEFELELTCDQFKKFSQHCIDLAGQPYAIIELLQIALCDFTNGKIQFADQYGYICSELMCELLEDLGHKFNKPKYLITPKDIIDNLEK
jgi:hypothetical protein